jgi:23S rRNA (adenine2503-C2)-methyltransferase
VNVRYFYRHGTTTTDIRDLDLEEVKALVQELGEKPYRAKQLWEWLWKKKARSLG